MYVCKKAWGEGDNYRKFKFGNQQGIKDFD
jgi:hypothetical protein